MDASGSFDPDGNNLNYLWEFEGQSISGVSVNISKNDDFSGFAVLTLDINRNTGDEPPQLTPINDQVMDEGATLTVAIAATDLDDDSIVLASSNLPPFVNLTDNGDCTGTLTLTP